MHSLECFTRLKRRGRDDNSGTVGEGGEGANHHAEGVEERHRHTDAVGLGVAQQLTDEVSIVQQVAVR